eukprot:10298931-Alexandrium_andersonii.AAC.1
MSPSGVPLPAWHLSGARGVPSGTCPVFRRGHCVPWTLPHTRLSTLSVVRWFRPWGVRSQHIGV